MAEATIVKLADLANLARPVEISEGKQIMVRALTLKEMISIFLKSTDLFLPLYAAGLDGKVDTETLAPFLMSSPELVAEIIALASDEPGSAAIVESRMPATVQLIALSEIWKASVPDPKKGRELLSEVTALLQKAYASANSAGIKTELPSSPTLLPKPSNS